MNIPGDNPTTWNVKPFVFIIFSLHYFLRMFFVLITRNMKADSLARLRKYRSSGTYVESSQCI